MLNVLNSRGILNTVLLVLLSGSVLFASASQRGWSATLLSTTGPGIAATPTASALVPEASGSAQSWKLRLEFKELNLQLVGVATLQDQASCFIKSPGASEQMIYAVGDVIGGFRIKSIDSQMVTFERQGSPFQLTLGQSSGAEPAAAQSPAAVAAAANDVVKMADSKLKTRTTKYATAKLIDDASSLHKSKSDEDAPFSSVKSDSESSAKSHGSFSGGFDVPLRGELTSVYGYRRHPLGGGIRFHRGIDIAADYGTPIKAAAAGRIVGVFNSTANDLGRHVIIKHNDEYETLYGHMSRITVSSGQWVEKGEVIGREGSSGASTGPHLHFEVRRNKENVNPMSYLHGLK